jgi:hypothetical protein
MDTKLNKDWYPISESFKDKSDKIILYEFLELLPTNFGQFFELDTSNLLEIKTKNSEPFINGTYLLQAFNEAKEVLIGHLNSELNPWFFDDSKDDELKSAGLTNNSLRVKISLLNGLWHRIVEYVTNTGMRFLNFLNEGLYSLLDDFIRLLSVFLKSIRALFPPVEIFCELAEVILGVPLLAE